MPVPDPSTGNAAQQTQIDSLLFSCLEQPEQEWEAALEKACSTHPELAPRLRKRFEFLRSAGLTAAPEQSTSWLTADPTKLGSFRIERRLGSGGMGVVYLARQEYPRRQVALKLIRPEYVEDERSRRRFQHEIEAASRLDHPGISTVYEAGEIDGTPYIAMRYVDGRSLTQWLGDEPRPVERVVAMFESIATALHAAHEAGLVHRDVKPDNVIVDDADNPVVLDFGLARGAEIDQVALTLTGDRVGTPAYMAPEQVSIEHDAVVDRRADVYSLGVALYEAVAGRLPFLAPNQQSLYRQILQGDYPPPSGSSSGVSRDLEIVIQTAMERDRARRYATALALAEDLRRVRTNEPIHARPTSVTLRVRRWTQRNPVLATFTVVVTLGLVIVSSLYFDRESALRRERATALIGESRRSLEHDQTLGLAQALQAFEIERSHDTKSHLLHALTQSHEIDKLEAHDAWIGGIEVAPKNGPIITWDRKGWVIVWRRDGRLLHRLHHDEAGGAVTSVSISPKDPVFVSSGANGAKLWTFAGEMVRPLPRRMSAEFSPDGETLSAIRTTETSPFLGDTIEVWPVQDGRLASTASQELPHANVFLARPSPKSGDWIVSGGINLAKLWHRGPSRRYTLVKNLTGHAGLVALLEFSPDEGRLLTAATGQIDGYMSRPTETRDRHAHVWDLTGNRLGTLRGHKGSLEAARFSPDSKRLITSAFDGSVLLWDAQTLDFHRALGVLDRGYVRSVTATNDRILGAASGGAVYVWDAEGHLLTKLLGHDADATGGTFLPDGRIITVGGDTVRSWRESPEGVELFRAGHSRCYSARFGAGGARVVTTCIDGYVRVFDRETAKEIVGFDQNVTLYDAVLSADGQHMLSMGDAGVLYLTNVNKKASSRLKISPAPRLARALFAPDGKRFVVSGGRGLLFYGRIDSEQLTPRQRHPRELFAIAPGPQRKGFVTATIDGREVRLHSFDPEVKSRLLGRIETKAIWNMARDPSDAAGNRVVIAEERQARLIDLANNMKVVATWPPPNCDAEDQINGNVFCVEFSPDGLYLATASDDGSAVVWTRDGARVCSIRHPAGFSAARFTPDGRFLLTACLDGIARVYPLEDDEIEDRAVQALK